MSRRLKIVGLFGKRALKKRLYSAKETYNFKKPTTRSHPIASCGASGDGERERERERGGGVSYGNIHLVMRSFCSMGWLR